MDSPWGISVTAYYDYDRISYRCSSQAIQYKKYSTASDVWSFGVLMYEIWSLGHKPFESKTNHQVCWTTVKSGV